MSHSVWDKWKSQLSVKDFPKELQPVYSVLDSYHSSNTDAVNLSVGDLANLLFAHSHKDKEYYEEVLANVTALDVSEHTTSILIKSLLKQKLLKELALAAYDATEGRVSEDHLAALIARYNETSTATILENEYEFITDDLETLLNETYRRPGLRWRLAALNRMLGSLRGGDFGFIFARPETGKTTLLASETTFMAEQLTDEQGPIIWFNNEEEGAKVKVRCYQASLGATLSQCNNNTAKAKAAYLAKTKGKHMIFKPEGTINKKMVEGICAKYKPCLVVFDQIDKITGFDADREDLRLGTIYQWARDLAKQYHMAVIGVCQADGTGEGQKWLTMSHVANAKTAKQAEADWIVGVGKIADPGYDAIRYLNVSKNKLSGDEDTDPALRHGRLEVVIKADIARYEDI